MQTVNQKLKYRYQILKKIGMGAYGQVWKAKDKHNKNRIVAIKRIYDAFRNKTDAQRTYREICYHSIMKHPNIVKFYSLHQFQDKDIYLTLQYMQMDLACFLKQNTLTETHKLYIFYQIINAISYFHSSGLVHRDLKPSNILLNKNCEAKICDFGLIRSVAQSNSLQQIQMTQNIATKFYQAPQILLGSKFYGKPIDIWSLGCILGQMFLGKTLFLGCSIIDFLQSIVKICGKPSSQDINKVTQSETSRKIIQQITVNQKLSIKSTFNISNKHLIDLLTRMLQFNPQKRITIQQVKTHSLFNKFKNTVHEVKVNKPLFIPHDKKQALEIKKYQELIKRMAVPIYIDHLNHPQEIIIPHNLVESSRPNNLSFLNSVKRQRINYQYKIYPESCLEKIIKSKSPQKQQQKNKKKYLAPNQLLTSINTTSNFEQSQKNMRSLIFEPQVLLKDTNDDNHMVNSVKSFTNYKRKQEQTFNPQLQYYKLFPEQRISDNTSYKLRKKSDQ